MGGRGSGRSRSLDLMTTESLPELDVNWMRRQGCLTYGWCGRLEWASRNRTVASVGMRLRRSQLWVEEEIIEGDRRVYRPSQVINLVHANCNFGGIRHFFVCGGVVSGAACRRRTTKLYFGKQGFLCRNCYGLRYPSQHEDELERALRRAQDLREHLGASPRWREPLPKRPKGMWRRTYNRICDEIHDAEATCLKSLLVQMDNDGK